ncbi:MAG: hypothetical protein NTX52_03455 [Planctomycetota bacterium]|nr:hypothetical protein [Planctomycetota bacterium]
MVKLQPPPLNGPKEDGLNLITGFEIARKRPKNYVFSLEKLTFWLNTYGFGVRLAERPDKKVRNLDRYNTFSEHQYNSLLPRLWQAFGRLLIRPRSAKTVPAKGGPQTVFAFQEKQGVP